MMTAKNGLRCRATTHIGDPCGAPAEFIDPATGLCPAHSPGGTARLREAGRKGAEATAKKLRGGGLESTELPPLNSPQAAAVWLEAIGRAVACGRLSHRDAVAATKAVREWLRAHEAGAVADQVEELRRKVSELKGGDLEVVK